MDNEISNSHLVPNEIILPQTALLNTSCFSRSAVTRQLILGDRIEPSRRELGGGVLGVGGIVRGGGIVGGGGGVTVGEILEEAPW